MLLNPDPEATHSASGRVVQALQQGDERALPAAAEADQRHHAPRLQRQADAAQREDLGAPRVPELDITEVHLPSARLFFGYQIEQLKSDAP